MRDISLGKPSDEYLEPSRTSMMKLFNENNWWLTCSTVLLIVSPLSTPKYTLLTYWQRLIYSIYRCWRTHTWKVSWKSKWSSTKNPPFLKSQKQLCRGVLTKTCSENMQLICRKTPMPKRDFNKVTFQFHWNCISACVFSCKFAHIFRTPFQNTFGWLHLKIWLMAVKTYGICLSRIFSLSRIFLLGLGAIEKSWGG